MQCVNCFFENLPGLERCGRCGASLRLCDSAVDVHPPRAPNSSWIGGRVLRRLRWSMRRRIHRIGEAVALETAPMSSLVLPDRSAFALLVRCIVPGWPQRFAGQRVRGRVMWVLYLATLVAAVLFAGTPTGGWLLGIALACHFASVVDAVAALGDNLRARIAASLVGITGVILLVYVPVAWVVAGVARPARIHVAGGLLHAGDVVLWCPWAASWATFEPGDLVYYRVPRLRIPQPGRIIEIRGDRMDRILAGPGQHVSAAPTGLRVDGAEPVPGPLVSGRALPNRPVELTVPADHFLLLPSGDNWIPGTIPPADWQRLALVHASRIRGPVYFRWQPWSRWGLLR